MSAPIDPFDFQNYAERTVATMASMPPGLFDINSLIQRWGKELIATGIGPTATAGGPTLDPAAIEKGQGKRWERACRVLRALHQIRHAIAIGRVDLAVAVAFKVPECTMLQMSREMALASGLVPDDMREEPDIEVHMDGEDRLGVGMSPDFARGIRYRHAEQKAAVAGRKAVESRIAASAFEAYRFAITQGKPQKEARRIAQQEAGEHWEAVKKRIQRASAKS